MKVEEILKRLEQKQFKLHFRSEWTLYYSNECLVVEDDIDLPKEDDRTFATLFDLTGIYIFSLYLDTREVAIYKIPLVALKYLDETPEYFVVVGRNYIHLIPIDEDTARILHSAIQLNKAVEVELIVEPGIPAYLKRLERPCGELIEKGRPAKYRYSPKYGYWMRL